MNLEVLIGAIAKQLRAARSKVGEPSYVIAPASMWLFGGSGLLFALSFSFKTLGEECNRFSTRKLLKGKKGEY